MTVDDYIDELKNWEHRLCHDLLYRHPGLTLSDIDNLLAEMATDPQAFHDKRVAGGSLKKKDLNAGKIPRSMGNALGAIVSLRKILNQCEHPLPETIPLNNAAGLVKLAFYAGLNTGMTIAAKIEQDDLTYRSGGKGKTKTKGSPTARMVEEAVSDLIDDGFDLTRNPEKTREAVVEKIRFFDGVQEITDTHIYFTDKPKPVTMTRIERVIRDVIKNI